MSRPIKVLMVLSNLRVSNGVSSYAMNYFRELDHTVIHMDFVVFNKWDNPYEPEIEAAGGRVFLLPPLRNTRQHIKACKRILRDGHYDIIHDNTLLLTYPIMKLAKKYVPIRILHSHNSKLGETKKKENRNAFFLPFLRKQANAYAACSDLAAKAMFGDADYTLIPNVVDAGNYHFDAAIRTCVREKMGASGKRIIATVGRVAEQKNPIFALDVFELVADREPKAEYWWIGSGPLDEKVAEYARGLRHSDQVKLLGSRNDMRDLYQAIDLFLLPSRFEGLPVTGVEAQAMGLPCVISDTVTRELVYTDLVKFVSLKESKEFWAGIVLEELQRKGRTDRSGDLLRSRFASNSAGVFLERYYKRLVELQN